jgi:hypothetical protein
MKTSDEQPHSEPEERKLRTADLASVETPTHPENDPQNRVALRDENGPADSSPQPLFPADDADRFRSEWIDIQTEFVDEPRRAVERGDELVAHVVQRLAESFSTERANLERQWDRGGDVSTEDLRVALQRYRSFFERLLAA